MILIYILAGIFFLCVLILLVPVKYDLKAKINNDIKFYFTVKLFFGIIKYDNHGLKILGIKLSEKIYAYAKKKKRKQKQKIKKNKTKRKFDFKSFDYENLSKIIKPSLKLIKNIFRKMSPEKIIFRGVIGFENPAHTGYLCAIESFLSEIKNLNLELTHDFDGEILNLEIWLCGGICPLNLIFTFVKYMSDKNVFLFFKSNFFCKGD